MFKEKRLIELEKYEGTSVTEEVVKFYLNYSGQTSLHDFNSGRELIVFTIPLVIEKVARVGGDYIKQREVVFLAETNGFVQKADELFSSYWAYTFNGIYREEGWTRENQILSQKGWTLKADGLTELANFGRENTMGDLAAIFRRNLTYNLENVEFRWPPGEDWKPIIEFYQDDLGRMTCVGGETKGLWKEVKLVRAPEWFDRVVGE